MKRTKISFVGEKPIFTGSPQIVPGGFNLDREKQRFSVGDIIPAGTLAIFDEVTRKVQIVKTAKVKAIGTKDKKVITLYRKCRYITPYHTQDTEKVSFLPIWGEGYKDGCCKFKSTQQNYIY